MYEKDLLVLLSLSRIVQIPPVLIHKVRERCVGHDCA